MNLHKTNASEQSYACHSYSSKFEFAGFKKRNSQFGGAGPILRPRSCLRHVGIKHVAAYACPFSARPAFAEFLDRTYNFAATLFHRFEFSKMVCLGGFLTTFQRIVDFLN